MRRWLWVLPIEMGYISGERRQACRFLYGNSDGNIAVFSSRFQGIGMDPYSSPRGDGEGINRGRGAPGSEERAGEV